MCEHCSEAMREANLAYHETGASMEAAMDPGFNVGEWMAREVRKQLALRQPYNGPVEPCENAEMVLEKNPSDVKEGDMIAIEIGLEEGS